MERYLEEMECLSIMKDIFRALNYCHSKRIVHRDLKPENLMYSSDRNDALLKIIDFGTSRVFNKAEGMHKKRGTVDLF